MTDTNSFKLDNGLRVIHHYDGSTPMAAVDILYNVGSRDESPAHTGMAHLFEHLMFGGSAHVADYDKAIEMAGGWNNAWTNSDYTNFFDILPAVNVETAFWAESDRMVFLSLNEKSLDVQRHVVVEEFKQTCMMKPYGDMGHLLRGLLYKVHPYRWPTIGLAPEQILEVTQQLALDFYRSHYAPNNAVLAVTGNVTLSRVKELADKWFGALEPRHIAPRTYAPEPPVTQPRLLEVRRDVPAAKIVMAWPMGGYHDPHYTAADILTDILANGKSSRFQRRLTVAGGIFDEAGASILGSDEPGCLMVTGTLRASDPATVSAAVDTLREQTVLARDKGVDEIELQRAVNKFESNLIFNNIGYQELAQTLAMCEMHGENVNDILPRYSALTTDDIADAARAIIDPQRECTLLYLPESPTP